MGEDFRRGAGERQVNAAMVGNWIQFATLLLAIVAFAMHVEGRLARIEQQMSDEKEQRLELFQQINRIELRVDRQAP